MSTLRSALELKSVFERLQAAEQSGVSPEELRKLEEAAAEQGLRTLWKGAKLEVESVLRETCDLVLGDPAVPREKRDLRAAALHLMGEAFASISSEPSAPSEDYVRIETAASKQRDAARAAAAGEKPKPEATPKQ